ncbi:hypothetical protein cyc_05610 [Cyclospora cayetanensis]|uniref:Uncharacterized protein n=1 Tax=Cyclospora cayetanensis TaxID=88456 RepID=A0A1D3CZP8_9EIME|nr:hypothetical protein cyc_05610 [Cyclospora cayetanensis]
MPGSALEQGTLAVDERLRLQRRVPPDQLALGGGGALLQRRTKRGRLNDSFRELLERRGGQSNAAGESDEEEESEHPPLYSQDLSVNLVLVGAGLSLIDSKPAEILYASVELLQLSFKSTQEGEKLRLSVGWVQVDNHAPMAYYPTMLRPITDARAADRPSLHSQPRGEAVEGRTPRSWYGSSMRHRRVNFKSPHIRRGGGVDGGEAASSAEDPEEQSAAEGEEIRRRRASRSGVSSRDKQKQGPFACFPAVQEADAALGLHSEDAAEGLKLLEEENAVGQLILERRNTVDGRGLTVIPQCVLRLAPLSVNMDFQLAFSLLLLLDDLLRTVDLDLLQQSVKDVRTSETEPHSPSWRAMLGVSFLQGRLEKEREREREGERERGRERERQRGREKGPVEGAMAESMRGSGDSVGKVYLGVLDVGRVMLVINIRNKRQGTDEEEQPHSELIRGVLAIMKSSPYISDANLVFASEVHQNLCGPLVSLVSDILQKYIGQAIKQIFQLLGAVDLLGNPVIMCKHWKSGARGCFYEFRRGLALWGTPGFAFISFGRGFARCGAAFVAGVLDSSGRFFGSWFQCFEAFARNSDAYSVMQDVRGQGGVTDQPGSIAEGLMGLRAGKREARRQGRVLLLLPAACDPPKKVVCSAAGSSSCFFKRGRSPRRVCLSRAIRPPIHTCLSLSVALRLASLFLSPPPQLVFAIPVYRQRGEGEARLASEERVQRLEQRLQKLSRVQHHSRRRKPQTCLAVGLRRLGLLEGKRVIWSCFRGDVAQIQIVQTFSGEPNNPTTNSAFFLTILHFRAAGKPPPDEDEDEDTDALELDYSETSEEASEIFEGPLFKAPSSKEQKGAAPRDAPPAPSARGKGNGPLFSSTRYSSILRKEAVEQHTPLRSRRDATLPAFQQQTPQTAAEHAEAADSPTQQMRQRQQQKIQQRQQQQMQQRQQQEPNRGPLQVLKKAKVGKWLLGRRMPLETDPLKQTFVCRWVEFSSKAAALHAFDLLSQLLDSPPGQGLADRRHQGAGGSGEPKFQDTRCACTDKALTAQASDRLHTTHTRVWHNRDIREKGASRGHGRQSPCPLYRQQQSASHALPAKCACAWLLRALLPPLLRRRSPEFQEEEVHLLLSREWSSPAYSNALLAVAKRKLCLWAKEEEGVSSLPLRGILEVMQTTQSDSRMLAAVVLALRGGSSAAAAAPQDFVACAKALAAAGIGDHQAFEALDKRCAEAFSLWHPGDVGTLVAAAADMGIALPKTLQQIAAHAQSVTTSFRIFKDARECKWLLASLHEQQDVLL